MRTRCTVNRVFTTPFFTTRNRPFKFLSPAIIMVWLTRAYSDGRVEKALLQFSIKDGLITDGASTFWPISLLVPNWRQGDDGYNAGPAAHDILYALEGIIVSTQEPVKLSREEVDDILRGIWRCWGMSRFLAGCSDKAIELVAGGKRHWGSDKYGVKDRVEVTWETLID